MFFGGNENKKKFFWNLLTFSQSSHNLKFAQLCCSYWVSRTFDKLHLPSTLHKVKYYRITVCNVTSSPIKLLNLIWKVYSYIHIIWDYYGFPDIQKNSKKIGIGWIMSIFCYLFNLAFCLLHTCHKNKVLDFIQNCNCLLYSRHGIKGRGKSFITDILCFAILLLYFGIATKSKPSSGFYCALRIKSAKRLTDRIDKVEKI